VNNSDLKRFNNSKHSLPSVRTAWRQVRENTEQGKLDFNPPSGLGSFELSSARPFKVASLTNFLVAVYAEVEARRAFASNLREEVIKPLSALKVSSTHLPFTARRDG